MRSIAHVLVASLALLAARPDRATPDVDSAAIAAAALARADAAVPSAIAREIAARAAERGLPSGPLLAPVREAAVRGVPPELVAAKVLEGIAKGASPERIADVARALGDRLAQASALLAEVRGGGLAVHADGSATLSDLAGALGAGVPPGAVRELAASAQSGSRSGDSVVAAARTVAELAGRGVPVDEALPLARALAARPPLPPGSVAGLFDAYRAEGGRDPRAFLGEAEHRARAGVPLDGMVDVFGDGDDGLVRTRGKGDDAPAGRVDGEERGRTGDVDAGNPLAPGLQGGPKKPKKPRK